MLQQSKDNELSLYGKEHGMARDKVAQLTVLGLSSQPVDQVKRGKAKHAWKFFFFMCYWNQFKITTFIKDYQWLEHIYREQKKHKVKDKKEEE